MNLIFSSPCCACLVSSMRSDPVRSLTDFHEVWMRNVTLRYSWKDYISNEQLSVDSSVKLQTCSVLTINVSVKEPFQVKWFTMRWPGKWCRQGAFVSGDKARDGTLGRERETDTEWEAGAMLWNLPRDFWVNVHGWQPFGMLTSGEF